MTEAERDLALEQVEEYLKKCKTKAEVDRGIAMILEIEAKYTDRLLEIIEQVSPEYVPMEAK